MSGDSFQVRFHPKLGTVIYDAVAQLGLAKEQIRLFKLSTMSAHTFMRAIVSKDLSDSPADPPASISKKAAAEATEAVDLYRTAKNERRKPYCEHCRRHFGSVDFLVCGDCSAIRCTCGTCGCATSTRRRRAA